MTILELISSVNAHDAISAWKTQHDDRESGWGTVETFERFRDRLVNHTISVADELKFAVMRKREIAGSTYLDVSSSPNQLDLYAFDFIKWEVARTLEIINDVGLSDAEVAAVIYDEMTWHGWPETAGEKLDNILYSVESIKRDLGVDFTE